MSSLQEWRLAYTNVEHGGWLDLYNQWWGPKGKAALDAILAQTLAKRVIPISQAHVRGTMRMDPRLPFLLVRDEYLTFGQRLRNTREGSLVKGSLLLGQPGIGTHNLCTSLSLWILVDSSIFRQEPLPPVLLDRLYVARRDRPPHYRNTEDVPF